MTSDFGGKTDDEDGGGRSQVTSMTTISRHYFGDESDESSFSVSIIEVSRLGSRFQNSESCLFDDL